MQIAIQPGVLKELLKRALVCASEDDTRPHLSMLHLEVKEGKLWVTATNGHTLCRLSACKILSALDISDGSVNISAADAREMVRLLPKAKIRTQFKGTTSEKREMLDALPWTLTDASVEGDGVSIKVSNVDVTPLPYDAVTPKYAEDAEQGKGPIGLASHYLADVGAVFDGRGVKVLRSADDKSPVLFQGEDKTFGISGLMVVMPVRI
jgi:DNA polymerase III sliding clamp (beta) subunit (PCNA family)